MKENLIEVKGLTKRFGKVIANDQVNFSVRPGEIHALLGENGAGKSTLINMLSGVYTPDEGTIYIDGKKVAFNGVKDAIDAGIGTIYQHFKVVESMRAKDNILLGQQKGILINYKTIIKNAEKIKKDYGIDVDLEKYVSHMTVGERQNLEILKVMNRGANILILDEPTTVFTPQETKKLFMIMRKMKEQGCAVIFITHKLDEVMEISDRVTILRGGKSLETVNTNESTPGSLTDMMMGESLDLNINRIKATSKEVVLQVKDLHMKGANNRLALNGISFKLRKGEVLGIAGIAGCGQKELCEGIAGIAKIEEGSILLEGEELAGCNAKQIWRKGIALSFIPEDRLGMGLIGSGDMVDNLLLRSYKEKKGLLVDRKALVPLANEMIEDLEIKTPGINTPIRQLSGGNIQKILLGRELQLNPKVLIMAYPVRGLDVKTSYRIYDLIAREKAKGVSIIFIGEDLDVLLQISDRLMVMNQGERTGIVDPETATKEQVGLLMVGTKDKEEE